MADNNENIAAKKFIYRDKFSRNGWLNMLKERLELAKQLLNERGIIFISIDDNEHAYLKVLADEIFGEENFINNLFFVKNPGGANDKTHIADTTEFILFYAKNKNIFEINLLKKQFDVFDWKYNSKNNWYEKSPTQLEKGGDESFLIDRPNLGYVVYFNPKTSETKLKHDYNKEILNEDSTIEEIYKFDQNLISQGFVPIIPRFYEGKLGRWAVGIDKLQKMIQDNLIIFKNKGNNWKIYRKNILPASEVKLTKPKDVISFTLNSRGSILLKSIFSNNSKNVFPNPKPVDLVSYLVNLHPNNNAKILDFYAGSGTTGHAILELNKEDGGNRSYTLVTNNENNIGYDITYERLYRINKGLSFKNKENFEWSKENKSFDSNLNVFEIKYKNMAIDSEEKLEDLLEEVNKMLAYFDIKSFSLSKDKVLSKLRSLKTIGE
ncbi:site-specific DNA-methyltransferase [Mycoplasmopsis citelli]|uniref:site-specific DNA-methyltransferase n=1 Tax=Mycoplasmopsis citelli TaxID=171281 RepID=UPI002115B0D6|nr:site-specific DNA-methyltransferase [Mycoplasmopsis citelli]UUD36644.1 site-specific DNA-methyltransferase [Mycoplasmopsis citelli]